MSENNRAVLAKKQLNYSIHVKDVYKPNISKQLQSESIKRANGESDIYMKRSPPQIKVYNPPPLKQKHLTVEKLKKKHGLLSEQGNRELLNDISSYSSP